MPASTKKNYVFTLLLLFVMVTAGTWSKRSPQNAYVEDLAKHKRIFQTIPHSIPKPLLPERPKKKLTTVRPAHDVTAQLDLLLKRRKVVSEKTAQVQGYTVQVYAGRNRATAFKVRNLLYTHYPASKPIVKYNTSSYTVCLGKLLDKLEAYTMYVAIKQHMPQAILRPIRWEKADIANNQPTAGEVGLHAQHCDDLK